MTVRHPSEIVQRYVHPNISGCVWLRITRATEKAITHLNDDLLAQLDFGPDDVEFMPSDSKPTIPKMRSHCFGVPDKQAPRLSHPAASLRPREKIPSQVPHPRRAAGRMGRRLELSLEPRTLRRQRLRRRHDQLPRLDGLWPGHRRRHQRRLGRQALHRSDARPRLRRAALSLHRQDARVRPRRELRRLHGQLGSGPHQPLQVHRLPRRHVQP